MILVREFWALVNAKTIAIFARKAPLSFKIDFLSFKWFDFVGLARSPTV